MHAVPLPTCSDLRMKWNVNVCTSRLLTSGRMSLNDQNTSTNVGDVTMNLVIHLSNNLDVFWSVSVDPLLSTTTGVQTLPLLIQPWEQSMQLTKLQYNLYSWWGRASKQMTSSTYLHAHCQLLSCMFMHLTTLLLVEFQKCGNWPGGLQASVCPKLVHSECTTVSGTSSQVDWWNILYIRCMIFTLWQHPHWGISVCFLYIYTQHREAHCREIQGSDSYKCWNVIAKEVSVAEILSIWDTNGSHPWNRLYATTQSVPFPHLSAPCLISLLLVHGSVTNVEAIHYTRLIQWRPEINNDQTLVINRLRRSASTAAFHCESCLLLFDVTHTGIGVA